jgi:CheY-like chemotaxis protein
MTEEKRRHKRMRVDIPITINRSLKARVVNLSDSGFFVETLKPMEIGAALVIQFDEVDRKMMFGAIVRQSNRKKRGAYGFGAELGSLTPDHKAFMRALIESIMKIKSENPEPVILMIDKNATSRFTYGEVIREEGYVVITRETFKDISVVFGQYMPVAIVCDYTEDTFEAVKSIREINEKVPIVILSRVSHIPIEKFAGLDVKHCPKYIMPPEKFFNEVLLKLLPR